jgi:hypothetical protein
LAANGDWIGGVGLRQPFRGSLLKVVVFSIPKGAIEAYVSGQNGAPVNRFQFLPGTIEASLPIKQQFSLSRISIP